MLYERFLTGYGFDKIIAKNGEVNKEIIYKTLFSSVLKKAYMMLDYENVPENIPKRMIKHYLIMNGHFAGFNLNGENKISWGTFAGVPDEYYFPKEYIINNPYMQMDNRTLNIGSECIIVKNDSMGESLLPIISKYVNMLMENETSMIICDILTRAQGILSTKDDTQLDSAREYLKRLFEGRIIPVNSESFTNDNMESVPFGTSHYTLTDLIEYEQYIRSSLYSELGIRLNFNMKRESLNAEETSMDEELLKPYIDNMVETQTEDLLMLSEFWKLPEPIKVKRGSIWETQEKKDDLTLEKLEKEVENMDPNTPEENSGEDEPEEKEDPEEKEEKGEKEND